MMTLRGDRRNQESLEIVDFKTAESFRLMVESVADYALFVLDPDGRIATWNLGAERIKLYRADEIIGRHFSIFYPPEALESGVPECELSLARQNGRHEDEGWRLRKGGSRFWANVVITALRDQLGELVGYGKVTRDLTERRRAEQGLIAAYDEISSVLECTSDCVVKMDKHWRLAFANRNAAGLLRDFYLGEDYWECFPHVRGTELEGKLRKAMADRLQASYEIFYEPYQRWYRGMIYPAHDGLTIFFRDVTEEKQLQEEVERGRFLKEKRIEALAHMAGGLAHEISNPLAIIHATAADLLQEGAEMRSMPSAQVRTACETIVKTSNRAIRILRGLKGFGREAGKDPVTAACVYQIVEQSIEAQGLRFDRHKVDLQVDLRPDLPFLECRETQIGQIVTNLLNNAFDAIVQAAGEPQNGVPRWVRLEAHSAGEWLYLEVSDSGPGIPDDVRAHLMEPFFTTKDVGLGMGIGLSLSKAIALEHGGTLTLASDSPYTCFRLALPAKPQQLGQSGRAGD